MVVDFITLCREYNRSFRHTEFDARFWKEAEAAGLKRWRKGQSIATIGRRLLIGLASYSGYDLELAQDIANMVPSDKQGMTVEFFNILDVQDPADFDNYIPAMQSPTPVRFVSTPAVGLWENGVLVQTAQAFHGREMVRRLLFE
jgi:hypothetical protein